jgi:hypothetical protein
LFTSLELKRRVSSLLHTSEHRQPLFPCLEFKRSVSSSLDEILSSLLKGSERQQLLLT